MAIWPCSRVDHIIFFFADRQGVQGISGKDDVKATHLNA